MDSSVFDAGYGLCVLIGGLLALSVLVYRGHSIFVVAPACAFGVLLFSGADPIEGMTGRFMAGMADYVRRFYWIFALGASFGKLMEHSGAAVRIAQSVVAVLGPHRACLAVVLACAALTYGGVSLFVVGFSVYPLAARLFREAHLPHRFIPASIAFGSITFTMTTAGSPEIQNLIPIQYLIDSTTKAPLTDAMAGWPVSFIVAAMMFLSGQWYLDWAIRREVRRSQLESISERSTIPDNANDASAMQRSARLPGLAASIGPLVLTLAALNGAPHLFSSFPADPTIAIFIGVAAAIVCLWPYASPSRALTDGFANGLLAIGATGSVVGFGAALRTLPAFELIVSWVVRIPGDPLIGAALAVAVIAGIAGSASGGQGLALPIIKPIYVDQLGVAPRALHRVVAIASGSLDSLPANGYVVLLIRNVCGETHARAYGPIFVTTVLIPLAGTAAAIALFRWAPQWGRM
jgi:H+/gluconate symporter-like permease